MKLAVMALLTVGLMAAGNLAARSSSMEWPGFPKASLQQVVFVSSEVVNPPRVDREVELTLVMGLPYGCYRPDVSIEHRDAFTHVLRPVLLEDQVNCIRPSSINIQRLSLGYLSEGAHQVLIENVQQPASPVTFWVEETGDERRFDEI